MIGIVQEKIVLVIDDMPEVLSSINEILGDNYDIRLVKSAPAAMSLLTREKIDLIILDIDMPVFSGFDFQEFIRQKPETKKIPVLFITSLSDPKMLQKAQTSGAAGLIAKPFTAQELKDRIQNVLHQKV